MKLLNAPGCQFPDAGGNEGTHEYGPAIIDYDSRRTGNESLDAGSTPAYSILTKEHRREGCNMALLQERTYTMDDIYALPDGERAELIDGNIYYMAPPSRRHQDFVVELSTTINNYIKSNNGDCKPYVAPFAVFLNGNDKNYVEPDISVICDTGKLNDKGCNGAPDWIIEVASPSSKRMDYMTKLFKYRTAGVREYWITDPDKNRVTVYYFETDFVEEYTLTDKVKVNIYEDFEIDFSTMNF